MSKTVPTSKNRSIPSISTEEKSKNPQNEIPYMDWETLIDISEEASSLSLREFIINHIGFKAYISYKLKQKKAIWEVDVNMIISSLEDLENLKEYDQKLGFLTKLINESQLEQYIQWLNQNNL